MLMSVGDSASLDASYKLCRQINRQYGTTYYWAAQILPADKRCHVHALYAFARYADDLVDEVVNRDDRATMSADALLACRTDALADFGDRLFRDIALGSSDDPILKAVVNTVQTFDLPTEGFERFLRSMTMDLTITDYATWDDLLGYMDGSAAVIGELMLPILEPVDRAAATVFARELGNAFQLTNFLRDIGEDLDRGRQYVPQEDLARFGVDLTRRQVDDAFRELMRFEINRCRGLYDAARGGLSLLPSRSARCVTAAFRLYGDILGVIEANDYQVFNGRLSVPTRVKVWEATRAMTSPRRRVR